MLSDKERAIIFKLVEELTGATQTGDTRQDSLITNVERRMKELNFESVVDYLKYVEQTPAEYTQLVSALTIHTTSWFRENPHFVAFQEILLEALKKNEVFKVWCAAASTGEEVYSFALMLEEFRRVHPTFDYRILGTDIDAISLAVAERAVYSKKQMNFHVIRYKNHILEGSGKTADYFTLSKDIRSRCTFRQHDLRSTTLQPDAPFHVCICRNVLIYFSPETVGRVVSNLLMNVKSDGFLMLGHSEAINAQDFGLSQLGHSVYTKRKDDRKSIRPQSRYRILSIDDSASTRKYLEKTFTELGFESVVMGTASEATAYLNFNDVDLITLDLKMPDMTGDKWLQIERKEGLKTPVVILSEVHASDADEVVQLLAIGAQDYIGKEELRADPRAMKERLMELIRAGAANKAPSANVGGAYPSVCPDLVMIGASTGGPQALVKVLTRMPANCPAVMITQHMSPKFTKPLAERICDISGLKMGKMENDSPILPGHLYLSQGDYHLGVGEEKGQMVLKTSTAPAFNGHRPSVDFMFNSALGINSQLMAILLTGMGRDGALGLRFLRKEGAFCVAQSEEDCVVYGMPKEAIEREAADFVGNLDEIRNMMLDSFNLKKKKAA